jgi:alpha/beta superfamily hydrolase
VARRTGWSLLLAEYRGYAGLPGRSSHAGAARDAMAAYRWLRDVHGVPAAQVALFGYSLGSAVAAELAAALGTAERPAVLVLQAPFTATHDLVREIAPRWLAATWPLIGRVPFDTRERVAGLDVPVWVVHGTADRVIPPRMGPAVHAAARRPADCSWCPARTTSTCRRSEGSATGRSSTARSPRPTTDATAGHGTRRPPLPAGAPMRPPVIFRRDRTRSPPCRRGMRRALEVPAAGSSRHLPRAGCPRRLHG